MSTPETLDHRERRLMQLGETKGTQMNIQDQAYSEAMDEIARLKEDLWTAKQDIAALAIRRTRYESLLTRAADALSPEQNPVEPPDYAHLIAELRHAAK
ncbi:MAG TPA: hypothetical protein VN957_27355 [Chthoniobacterales bacterium]|nr:hypothetical protein [Chthoniobacterales bacterium]